MTNMSLSFGNEIVVLIECPPKSFSGSLLLCFIDPKVDVDFWLICNQFPE
jgi:hypothetical protein